MKNILVVEDDKFLMDVYIAKLSTQSDLSVQVAHDGNEALEAIKNTKPDAIILDLVMPNLDGYKFLEELGKLKLGIPVLVASNLDSGEKIEKAMELGASDFFVKSDTTIEEIVNKVRALAGGEKPE